MKKWGFCLVVIGLIGALSFLNPSSDFHKIGIQVLAPAASAADSGPKVSKTGIPYASDKPPAGSEAIYNAVLVRRGGNLLNLDRMLLNSPEFAQGWNTMFGAIRGKLVVDLKLRELAIVTIGAMNKADYEWEAHAPIFLKAGGSQQQLDAIKKGVPDALKNTKLFDEMERATL
jgi:alkylhydroperoxidase family enzyme